MVVKNEKYWRALKERSLKKSSLGRTEGGMNGNNSNQWNRQQRA
jgi:hypothetical protein